MGKPLTQLIQILKLFSYWRMQLLLMRYFNMAYEGPHPLPVPSGGTGDATFTAYAPVCGGTTSTGALQQATTGLSSSGFVLTSNGSSALPSWQASGSSGAFTSINIQTFTSSGTYTPTAGMISCIVEAVGGGGAGGGSNNSVSGWGGGAGGGSAGYSRGTFSAAAIGASQTVTIGSGGIGVNASTGGNGGNTTFGALLTANGGHGGAAGAGSSFGIAAGGVGGTASGGSVNINGNQGNYVCSPASNLSISGKGADSILGIGGPSTVTPLSTTLAGKNATGYGAGGGGGNASNTATTTAGGAGTGGIVIVTEFI
jgi:hypothetical protein